LRPLFDEAIRRALAGAVLIAKAIGAVLLTVVYWLVLGPVSLTLRLLGVDLLGTRGKATSAWTPLAHEDAKARLEGAG
jgi:hypothetical protein